LNIKKGGISMDTTATKRGPARTVDDYLASIPKDQRAALEKLRRTISEAVPDAVETISYRIPIYKYLGMLVGFAAFKDHCSFMVMSPAVILAHKGELGAFKTTTGTVHFTPKEPLPAALVIKLVTARIRENEERRKKRRKK
jgi:uncharacterized protein YdhG (YjbR/CyaY superfamily)